MGSLVDETQLKNISELEDMRIETSKTEKQRNIEKIYLNRTRTEYPRTVDNYKSCNINVMVIPEEEREKRRNHYLKQ